MNKISKINLKSVMFITCIIEMSTANIGFIACIAVCGKTTISLGFRKVKLYRKPDWSKSPRWNFIATA